MKKTILISVFFLATSLIYAQKIYFEGIVTDGQLSSPIEGALVSIDGTKFITETDADGKFIFKEKLPVGQHGVIIEKEKFETEIFLIDVSPNTVIDAKKIKLRPTKDELSKRKKIAEQKEKEERKARKEDERKIAEIEKEKRKKEKENAKRIKRLRKKNPKGKEIDTDNLVVDYKDSESAITYSNIDPAEVKRLQEKYSEILGVEPSEITNIELYDLIDEWDDVSYKMGGVTKNGIDCSSFTQLIYTSVFNHRLERTADLQFHSDSNDEFKNKDRVHEGDLVFFTGVGKDNNKINHVGVYLYNDMFVHSTSNADSEGNGGVQISNLNDKYWSTKFVAFGRQIIEN